MIGSRFLAPTVSTVQAKTGSKFLVQGALGHFLVRHPGISRFIAHIPGASKFLRLPPVAHVEHIKPMYNRRARRPQPRFRL